MISCPIVTWVSTFRAFPIVITDYTEDIEVIFEMHLVLFINPIKFERDLAVMSETFG